MNEPGVAPIGSGDARPVWQTRFYEPGDEAQVASVLSRAFGSWPRREISCSPVEHLRWKLSSHPAAAPLCVVTEHRDRTVGWQGYWLQMVKLDNQELLSRHSVDFAVDREYQRMGIKVAMRERAQVNNSRRNFALHFDPRSSHPAFVHMRQKSGVHRANVLAQRVESRVLQVARLQTSGESSVSWRVTPAAAFDERVDALWEEASKPFRLLVVRRAPYLNWRYADTRGGDYTIHIAEQDNCLLGYVVARLSFARGLIADVFALPERPDVVRSLINAALMALRSKGAEDVECWLPEHHPYWEAIRQYPFDHKRRSIDYRASPSQEYIDSIDIPFREDPKAPVHITMGDSDVG